MVAGGAAAAAAVGCAVAVCRLWQAVSVCATETKRVRSLRFTLHER